MRIPPGPPASRAALLSTQRGIAVLLGDIGVDRFRRRMQQVAAQLSHRAVRDDLFVDEVVGPARTPAVEQASVPVRVAFAMREPAAEEAVAASKLVCRRLG